MIALFSVYLQKRENRSLNLIVEQFLRLRRFFQPELLMPAAWEIPLWVLPSSKNANRATKSETRRKTEWARN